MAKPMNRREAVRLLAAAPVAAAFEFSPVEVARALTRGRAARGGGQDYQPKFFTAHEWETVRLLVDLILPRDGRSGSATEAGVPEFMDFILADGDDERQTAMRGGLAWLDTECRERFGRSFLDCTGGERTAVLDDIAWPAKGRPELSHGIAWFNSFRDLTASGFWSSEIGVEDIGYMGNTAVAEWKGCPQEQLDKLGVSYD